MGERGRRIGLPRRRAAPLVPADDAASRSLVAVVAILAFLAGLAAGAAEIAVSAAAEWTASLGRDATIQIRPRPGRNAEADLASAAELARVTAGIAAVRPLAKPESDAFLEPWLGRGLDLAILPIPRLAVVTLEPGARPDLADLGRRLAASIPGATLDDHGLWLSRLSDAAGLVAAAASGLVALVLAASGLAVAFATRGAVAASRHVVDVLHLVGAEDRFIARQFAWRFFRFGLRGACLGAGASLVVRIAVAELSRPVADGSAVDPLVAALLVGWRATGLALGVVSAVAAIAAIVSGWTVKRFLRSGGAG